MSNSLRETDIVVKADVPLILNFSPFPRILPPQTLLFKTSRASVIEYGRQSGLVKGESRIY